MVIRSDHSFAHGTTAELSCHVQNCDLIWLLELKSLQNEFSQDVSYELLNHFWNGILVAIQMSKI